MAGNGQLLGLAGRVLAVLLVLSACAGADTIAAGTEADAVPVAGRVVPTEGPIVVDTVGAPLQAEHAELVRSVHRALQAGDLDALSALYTGDDWTGQAELLAQEPVRRSVLDSLRTHPANLGEGYVYSSPEYETAFFLDYDPPRIPDGPLRWRGIALPAQTDVPKISHTLGDTTRPTTADFPVPAEPVTTRIPGSAARTQPTTSFTSAARPVNHER